MGIEPEESSGQPLGLIEHPTFKTHATAMNTTEYDTNIEPRSDGRPRGRSYDNTNEG